MALIFRRVFNFANFVNFELFAKLFQRNLKNSNSQKIRPAKYKHHTVVFILLSILVDHDILCTRQQMLYQLSYRGSSAGWANSHSNSSRL